MDLLALADFNLVATHGGFGRASRASGRPKATLSRRVTELEESLGVRLFERGSRTLRLTEEGGALHTRTERLLNEITEAGEAVSEGRARPRGQLRVSTPLLFAHVAMGRIAAGFARTYPEVRLEVMAEDRFVDLVEEGFDLVIRVNPRPDETLVGRCFLRDELLVIAPPSHALPDGGTDAGATVPAVVLTSAPQAAVWRVSIGDRAMTLLPDPVLRLSSLVMVRDAVRAGAGTALLPRSMVAEDLASGRLVSWGTAIDRPIGVWVLHSSRRLASSKITAFTAFLAAAFPDASL